MSLRADVKLQEVLKKLIAADNSPNPLLHGVHLGNLTVTQVVWKYPGFYRTREFFFSSVHKITPHPLNPILSTLFQSIFPHNILKEFNISISYTSTIL